MIAPKRTETKTLTLIAVNTGTPSPLIDTRTGKETMTGIVKHTVPASTVQVGVTNIWGDQQADLEHHGGADKAVYCYPHDHLPTWREEIGYPDGQPAPFGENLSLLGATEDDIHVGDRWQWGHVVLEVAQPRWPCFKLGLHADLHDLPVRLIESERSGWYYRVMTEGAAPTVDARLSLMHRDPQAPTVREAFQAAKGLLSPDDAIRIANAPELAIAWRRMILNRYRQTERDA